MEKEVIKVSMDMNRFGEKGTTATGEDAHEDRTSEKQGKWINQDRSHLNEVYCFNEPVMDENGKCRELVYDQYGTGQGKVHEHNFGYYEERFGASIEAQKEKYLKSRHKKEAAACTVQNHYDSSKTGLQYISLQVSDKGYMNYKDRETFSKMCLEFCKSLEEEVKDASGNVIARVHCVGMTIHYDEVNAHSHHEIAFEVLDKKTGLWKPAQEDALKKLGYKPKLKETKAEKEAREEAEANGQTVEYFEGKRCNAKVAWTEQKREEWCKIVEKHLPYVEVDREAVRVKQKKKVDHEVYAGCEEVLEQMHDAKAEAREARQKAEKSEERAQEAENRAIKAENRAQEAQEVAEALIVANEDLKAENGAINEASRAINEKLAETGEKVEEANRIVEKVLEELGCVDIPVPNVEQKEVKNANVTLDEVNRLGSLVARLKPALDRFVNEMLKEYAPRFLKAYKAITEAWEHYKDEAKNAKAMRQVKEEAEAYLVSYDKAGTPLEKGMEIYGKWATGQTVTAKEAEDFKGYTETLEALVPEEEWEPDL